MADNQTTVPLERPPMVLAWVALLCTLASVALACRPQWAGQGGLLLATCSLAAISVAGLVYQVLGWSKRLVGALPAPTPKPVATPTPVTPDSNAEEAPADVLYANQALKLANAGTWRLNFADNPDVVYLSDRCAQIYGITSPAPDKRYSAHIWPGGIMGAQDPESARQALGILDQTIADGQSTYDVTYAFKRLDDGAVVWLRDVAELVYDPSGKLLSLLGITLDVTQTKRLEHEMQHAKMIAHSATQMKSDFLISMGHEIRTPMNSIIGLSHLALKTSLTPQQRDYLKKIHDAGQHLLGIINDILDFVKIEAGNLTVEEADFELAKVLEAVVRLVGEKTLGADVELIVNVNSAVPDHLRGDPVRLEQILVNYVNNAVKFTEKGEVSITVYPLQETEHDVLLRFDVRDSGVGLTQEQIGRMFQNAHQSEIAAPRKLGGAGLGLAIAKNLAELMHGEVGVESDYGKGANFWFTARLHKNQNHHSEPQLDQPDLRGRRVLVVDDNIHARLVLADLLNDLTFMVDSVDSGTAALNALQAEALAGSPFEIVFLDWQMPDMDGFEVAQQIAMLGLPTPPHLVMVTACTPQEARKMAHAAGIEDVLMKPAKAADLLQATLRVMRRSQSGEGTASQPQPTGQAPQSLEAMLEPIAGGRVLLAEDNPINQQVAREILTDAGFAVDIVEDGQAAVDKVLQSVQAWDLVLMDIHMPVLDGIAATALIRESVAAGQLNIVAMTASAVDDDHAQCLQAGMQDFISKPIEPEELWQAMLQWMRPCVLRPSQWGSDASDDQSGAATGALSLHIEGLDTRLGLQRVLGRESSYLRLLHSFMRGEKWAHKKMLAALAENDLATVKLLAHSTSGSAGNVAASQIEQLAHEIEVAVRDNHPRSEIECAVAALEQPLSDMMAALLEQLPPLTQSQAQPNQVQENLPSVTKRLLQMLADAETSALDVFEQHASTLQATYPSHFHALEAAIKNFDFKEAEVQLHNAIREVQT